MLDNLQIATPLANNENFHYIMQVIREELAMIDPKKFLIYLFDVVDASLLDSLAEQFDMLGYNGWVLAQNETQKRELLKSAFALHAIKGTPGGIEEVVARLGFPGIVVKENTGAPVDAINPWAYFTVQYVLPNERGLDQVEITNLLGLINAYKGAGDILGDFSFATPQQDFNAIRGQVQLTVRDVATNAVISDETIYNSVGLTAILELLDNVRFLDAGEIAAISHYMVKKISFGTSDTAQSDDYVITSPTTKTLDDNPDPVGIFKNKSSTLGGGSDMPRKWMRHWFSLGASEGNGKTYKEIGLVMEDQNGSPTPDVVLARITRAPIVKTSAIKIEGYWDIYLYPNINPDA